MIVFTDLDGTLLEEDGRLSPEARRALEDLRRQRVPVVPLTSKTRRELERWLARLDSGRAGAFENGAGISFEGEDEVLPGAVSSARPAPRSRRASRVRRAFRSFPSMKSPTPR